VTSCGIFSGGVLIVARVLHSHVVHMPRLRVHLPDNDTHLTQVPAQSCGTCICIR